MWHSYQRKIWISNLVFLTVAEALVLLLCFAVSRAVFSDTLADAYSQRLYAISSRHQQAVEMVEGFLSNCKVDPGILQPVAEYEAARSSWEKSQASLKLYQAINVRQSVSTPVSKIYIKAGNMIFDETAQYDTSAPSAGIQNVEYRQLLSEKALEDHILSRRSGLFRAQITLTGIGGENLVACVPDWKRVYQLEEGEALFLFEDKPTPVFRSTGLELTDAELWKIFCQTQSAPSGYVVFQDGARFYLAVSYRPPNSSSQYLLLNDCDGAIETLYGGLPPLLAVSLLLLLLSAPLFFLTARWITKPVWELIHALDGISDTYPENGLYPVILDLKRQSAIRRRIYLHSFSILLPLALLMAFSYSVYGGMMDRQSQAAYLRSVGQTAEQMDANAQHYRDIVKQVMFGQLFRKPLAQLAQEETAVEAVQEILRQIHDNSYLFSNVVRINFYDLSGNVLYSMNGDFLEPARALSQIEKEEKRSYGFAALQTDGLAAGHAVSFIPLRETGHLDRWLSSPATAYMELEFEDYLWGKPTDSSQTVVESDWYLYDRKAWRVTGDAAGDAYVKSLVEGLCQTGDLQAGEGREISFPLNWSDKSRYAGRTMYAAAQPVEDGSYRLVGMVGMEALHAGSRMLLYGSLLLLFLVVLAVGGAGALVTAQMVRPLRKLQDLFNFAQDAKVCLPSIFDNELSKLAYAFDGLLRRIGSLQGFIDEKEQQYILLEKRKKELELMALQAQIDPHLISNLFVTMRFLLKAGKSEELAQTLDAVGRFLRESAAHDGDTVEFRRELELLRSYVEIQNIRYRGRVRLDYAVEPEAERVRIPKFLLQPTVENAVVHGTQGESPLSIALSARLRQDWLEVVLENDGAPIADERLAELSKLLESGGPSDHIGLLNTAERLRLTYGADCALRVENLPEGGVRVTILVPVGELPVLSGEEETCIH